MSIKIIHADPERDSEPISKLIDICISEKRTVLSPYTPEEEKQYLENLTDRAAVFVAYIDGQFAGFAGMSSRWPYSDKLQHCGEGGTWVMPEFRGRGVGRALWEQGVFPWCRRVGLSNLGATVMAHNVGSIAFYEKLGFRVNGYHQKMVKWGEEYLDSVEIELNLI